MREVTWYISKVASLTLKWCFFVPSLFHSLDSEDVGDLHLLSSQPPTITLCNADLYNTWRLFTVFSLSFSFSFSLPLEKRQDARVPEIESPWRDIRDGRSSAQPLQKLHINESRRKKAPRPYRHIFPCSSDSFSLRSHFFFLITHFVAIHPLRSDIEFPIKFPLSSPIATLLAPPLTPCRFVLFRGNDPPVIIDSAWFRLTAVIQSLATKRVFRRVFAAAKLSRIFLASKSYDVTE